MVLRGRPRARSARTSVGRRPTEQNRLPQGEKRFSVLGRVSGGTRGYRGEGKGRRYAPTVVGTPPGAVLAWRARGAGGRRPWLTTGGPRPSTPWRRWCAGTPGASWPGSRGRAPPTTRPPHRPPPDRRGGAGRGAGPRPRAPRRPAHGAHRRHARGLGARPRLRPQGGGAAGRAPRRSNPRNARVGWDAGYGQPWWLNRPNDAPRPARATPPCRLRGGPTSGGGYPPPCLTPCRSHVCVRHGADRGDRRPETTSRQGDFPGLCL